MANKYFLCKTFGEIDNAIKFSYGNFLMRSPTYYKNLDLDQIGRHDRKDGQGFRFADVHKMFNEFVGSNKELNAEEIGTLEFVAAPLNSDGEPILEKCINLTPHKPVISSYDHINRVLRIFCLSIVSFDHDTGNLIKLNNRMYEFGEYTVFVDNIPEFFRKMNNGIAALNNFITGCSGPVEYYNYENHDGLINPFMKSKDFEYQNEFRYCIKVKSDTDVSIMVNIGNIEDIVTICKTSEFINITNIRDIRRNNEI